MTLPFTFGIPLIARAAARNWDLVEALLNLTLLSLRGQTQNDGRIIIAGHDRPRLALPFEFLEADWPAEAVRPDNLDSGRKKYAISQRILADGGGLLMFVDADDWVDVHLVEKARVAIGPDDVGGLIEKGFACDFRSLRAVSIPHPQIFDRGFHEICGSSTVAQLKPDDPDPLRRDPSAVLHEHYRWNEVAHEHGVALAHLDVVGSYVINTSANHSETHGPFTEWRRVFTAGVREYGADLDAAFLARFGLDMAVLIETRSRVLFGQPLARGESA